MNIKSMFAVAAVASMAAGSLMAQSSDNEGDDGGKITSRDYGQLICEIEGGWGLLIGSSKDAICKHEKADGGVDFYVGKLNKLGIDIGKTEDAYMSWSVYTYEDDALPEGALVGSYAGVAAEANLFVGLGANALVGGIDNQIALQPLALQGSEGVNIAIGLATLVIDSQVFPVE